MDTSRAIKSGLVVLGLGLLGGCFGGGHENDDRPFAMLCESGALIPGKNFNPWESRREAEKKILEQFAWKAGETDIPNPGHGILDASIGEYPVKGSIFKTSYGRYDTPVGEQKRFRNDEIASGTTGHFYIDADGKLNNVDFSLIRNGEGQYRGGDKVEMRQVVWIGALIPADARYAVYHRTVEMPAGSTATGGDYSADSFEGYWVTPLVDSYRYVPDEGTQEGKLAQYKEAKPSGRNLLSCYVNVSQQEGLYDDFDVQELRKGNIVPKPYTRRGGFDRFEWQAYVGPDMKALEELPEDPQDFYDEVLRAN